MRALKNVLVYSSNNSGGSWWLDDEDWVALEAAGWIVHWIHDWQTPHGDVVHDEPEYKSSGHNHGYEDELVPAEFVEGSEWLGCKAKSAAKETTDPEATVREWERITHQNSTDQGCNCCGEPHNFTFYDSEGKARYSSVEVVETSRSWW